MKSIFKERAISEVLNKIHESGGQLTLSELCKLHEQGFDFVVEGGAITNVLHR